MNQTKEAVEQRFGSSRTSLPSLIADLASNSGATRLQARRALVELNGQAVPALILALQDSSWRVRWEAAKALSEIHDPSSAPALVGALEDKRSDIRWLAAEGLIAIGHAALPPLLQALIHRKDSTWMREGAHHVLVFMPDEGIQKVLTPVVQAIEGIEPVIETPLAAQVALDALDRAKQKRTAFPHSG